MNELTVEQLQDLMHAVRHYQYHHISISNPRYEEFSNILNVIVEEIHNANLPGYSQRRRSNQTLLDRIDQWSDDESDIDT